MNLPDCNVPSMNSNCGWPCLQIGNPEAPGILFLHGFMGDAEDWLTIASELASNYYCVIPDLPGHGENINGNQTQRLDFEALTCALIQITQGFFQNPPALVGYSLGGRIALVTACTYPQKFSALCLEGANPGINSTAEQQARLESDRKLARKILEKGMETFVKEWYRLPLFASLAKNPELLNQVSVKRAQNDPYWMAKVIEELSPGLQPPLHSMPNKLIIPVLLVAGQLDEKYQTINRSLKLQFPRSEIATISGAGHNTHLENPRAFMIELKQFLSKNHAHN